MRSAHTFAHCARISGVARGLALGEDCSAIVRTVNRIADSRTSSSSALHVAIQRFDGGSESFRFPPETCPEPIEKTTFARPPKATGAAPRALISNGSANSSRDAPQAPSEASLALARDAQQTGGVVLLGNWQIRPSEWIGRHVCGLKAQDNGFVKRTSYPIE